MIDYQIDADRCWKAAHSRDARFDGMFILAVRTTGIYCRPSCPATTPKRANVTFFRTAAAAQGAGFRACKRCRPDAAPGSPEWDVRGDLVGRAMQMIADGVVDRDGVDALAGRLGYSTRHLNRVLTDELGAGPLAVARAQRAQTARTLIETTTLGMTEIAFAAGFGSVRQFNDTVREVYGVSPSELRARSGDRLVGPAGTVTVRLATRAPFAAEQLWAFIAARALPCVEHVAGAVYSRALDLPRGHGTVDVVAEPQPPDAAGTRCYVAATFRLADWRDLAPAVTRVRRQFDLDADPVAIDTALAGDPVLAGFVAATPGLRVAGAADPFEAVVKGIVGQQVSVAGARTVAGRLVAALGDPLAVEHPHLTHVFPSPAAFASAERAVFPMPATRAATLQRVGAALAAGEVTFDADRATVSAQLQTLRGIGPWTADYVRMRGLGDPDVFLPTDLGAIHALAALDTPVDPERWKPWRSYALHHLWNSL
ncbi:MAG TPA: Ada metal-binding domain-containing protein [Ilumatobacter sp.]|nr:Ada metal-binding domain-containing protein [Ilumatobacter sp.]